MRDDNRRRTEDYWEIVARIVEARGRGLQRYPFFEDVWRSIDEGKRLIIVRAPTGSGKTEAAAAPFLGDLVDGSRRWLSLMHILPTRSLVNAMRWRYAEAVGALGIGNAIVAYEYGHLLGVRPYLDGDIVVTTYDTMLARFYGVGLRAPHILGQVSKIINSLLVMDELQLLQDEYWYAMSILPHHVKALIAWGAQLVLMTATLPTLIQETILNQVVGGVKELHPDDIASISSKTAPARGDLSVTLIDAEMPTSGDELAQTIREHHPGKGPALIIANTVEKAAAVYVSLYRSYLEGKIALRPMLLHSRLRQGIRRKVEELLESERQGEFVLVATQVVEAGLDLDSTLLITEISPIDSLIQRIGRVGRRRDGSAIIYTRSEDAYKVYPGPLVEKSVNVISGFRDLLAECPRDLEAAQTLIDHVFSPDTVGMLARFTEKSWAVAEWVDRYWVSEMGIAKWVAHTPPDHLLRLGIELLTYRPSSLGEYEHILAGGEVRIKVSEFEKNLVKLAVRDADEGRLVMPALLHGPRDNHYVTLDVQAEEMGDTLVLTPAALPANRTRGRSVVDIIEGRKILLLNPRFYEEIEMDGLKLELGVVKPWRRSLGSA